MSIKSFDPERVSYSIMNPTVTHTLDHWQDGEDPSTAQDIDVGVVLKGDSIKNLMEVIAEFFGFDVKNISICEHEETGFIEASWLECLDGTRPSPEEIEQFTKGEIEHLSSVYLRARVYASISLTQKELKELI